MYKRTIKIPIHYSLTKAKLDKITARLTYGVQLFLDIIKREGKYTRVSIVGHQINMPFQQMIFFTRK